VEYIVMDFVSAAASANKQQPAISYDQR